MLQAMNTGHEGSMSTAHANSPQDLVSRLETMALMSDVDLPLLAIREQIGAAVDLIVHTARRADGGRVVARVSAVEGLRRGSVVVHDVFVRQRALHQGLVATGFVPSLAHLLQERGESVEPALFQVAAEHGAVRRAVPEAVHQPPRTDRAGRQERVVRARPGPRPHRTAAATWPGSARRLGTITE